MKKYLSLEGKEEGDAAMAVKQVTFTVRSSKRRTHQGLSPNGPIRSLRLSGMVLSSPFSIRASMLMMTELLAQSYVAKKWQGCGSSSGGSVCRAPTHLPSPLLPHLYTSFMNWASFITKGLTPTDGFNRFPRRLDCRRFHPGKPRQGVRGRKEAEAGVLTPTGPSSLCSPPGKITGHLKVALSAQLSPSGF